MKAKDLEAAGWIRMECGLGVEAWYSVIKNDERMCDAPDVEIATAEQVHSNLAVSVDRSVEKVPGTDALITSVSRLAPTVRTADCVPIVVNASDIGMVAAIHAGWRGSIERIVTLTVEKMIEAGACPENMYAAVGPHICTSCYEVSPELADEFSNAEYGMCVDAHYEGNPHLDLHGVNLRQLKDCGIPEHHIFSADKCTRHEKGEIFPSYRRNVTDKRLYMLIFKIE